MALWAIWVISMIHASHLRIIIERCGARDLARGRWIGGSTDADTGPTSMTPPNSFGLPALALAPAPTPAPVSVSMDFGCCCRAD